MNWARTTGTPVTTERRVRVVNAADAEGWAAVEWVKGNARLVGPVVDDSGDELDDAPEFVSSVRHLTLPPFAATLARLRESAGLTLQDLGDAAGLSRQRVHQLETGAVKPTWAVVQALATALDVSTEVFRAPES